MKKMNRVKLALDVLMLVLLLLMYKKNVLGLSFHEIGGMAVCGLFIIHKLLNGKWILVITGKLFSPKTAWRCKLNWMIDFLMLITFAYILISGIFISRVLFDGERGPTLLKTGHYAASALALVLTGVHLGLQYDSIITRTPARKLPLAVRRVSAVVLSAAILVFGVYQMTETEFLHWMSNLGAVIGTSQTETAEDHDALTDGHEAEGHEETEVHEEEATGSGGHGNGARDGQGKGLGNGNGAIANTEPDPSALGSVLLGFLSITLVFSTVIAWINGILHARRRSKRIKCAVSA